MFSLLEGPQQSAPTAVAPAAAAPAAEAMTGTRVFPDVSSKGVAEAPTSSAGAASAAEPAAAPATGGTVFLTTSVGGGGRAPASADQTAASKAVPATSGIVPSATLLRGAVGARESSAGAASSDAAAEAAPSTSDTTASDASVERAAMKLTSAAGSSSKICGERRAPTHPFDPDTVFPLEVRYYNSSWPKHGSNSNSSSSSNSNGNGSTRPATTPSATTTHGGKQSVLKHSCDPLIRGNDAGGVRGGETRFSTWVSLLTAVKHGGECSMEGEGLRAEGEFLVLFGLCREQLRFRLLDFILDGYLCV